MCRLITFHCTRVHGSSLVLGVAQFSVCVLFSLTFQKLYRNVGYAALCSGHSTIRYYWHAHGITVQLHETWCWTYQQQGNQSVHCQCSSRIILVNRNRSAQKNLEYSPTGHREE